MTLTSKEMFDLKQNIKLLTKGNKFGINLGYCLFLLWVIIAVQGYFIYSFVKSLRIFMSKVQLIEDKRNT